MKNRFLFMKLLGLLFVLIGFSYSITSFNNFFSCIFDYKIYTENLNIYIMSIGLILPLSVFIYGIYFYFYSDFNITRISKLIFSINIVFLIIAIVMIIINNITILKNILVFQIFEFIHISFAYCLILLSLISLFGCFKYKF